MAHISTRIHRSTRIIQACDEDEDEGSTVLFPDHSHDDARLLLCPARSVSRNIEFEEQVRLKRRAAILALILGAVALAGAGALFAMTSSTARTDTRDARTAHKAAKESMDVEGNGQSKLLGASRSILLSSSTLRPAAPSTSEAASSSRKPRQQDQATKQEARHGERNNSVQSSYSSGEATISGSTAAVSSTSTLTASISSTAAWTTSIASSTSSPAPVFRTTRSSTRTTRSSTSTVLFTTTGASRTQSMTTTTTRSSTSSTVTTTTATHSSTSSTVTTTSSTVDVYSPRPSLYCWSHMNRGGSEEDLIRMQLQMGISIFACNHYTVISTEKVRLGQLHGKAVHTWVNHAPEVGKGTRGINGATTNSYLNTRTFILAWDTLMNSGKLWSFDFVVKVDPDAVFFPSRLRAHVKAHVGETVYFANCGKWGGKVLLYGSLEVISSQALRRYWDQASSCKDAPWQGWGEDYYMQQCLDKLGVTSIPDLMQVADKRCVDAPCSDYTKVAFHDFKRPEQWLRCHSIAVGDVELRTDLVPRK